MSEAPIASIQRVLAAIQDAEIREEVETLLLQAVSALQRLAGLDDEIYRCYKLDDAGDQDEAELDLTLTGLQRRILGGTKAFLDFLKQENWLSNVDVQNDPFLNTTNDIDLDLVLGDDFGGGFGSFDGFDDAFREASPSRSSPSLPDLRSIDFDEVFGLLTPEVEVDIQEALGQVREELSPLVFAIQDQIRDFKGRVRSAFNEGNYTLVIRELDASRESLAEGLFALMATIYHKFTGDPNPPLDSLPGFRDALEQALIVRRGLSRLIRLTNPENDAAKNDDFSEHRRHEAIRMVDAHLENFINSETFHAMQAPDRWELVNFSRSLRHSSFRKACQASEGLSKYLESLTMMGPGELVQQHDQEMIQNINSNLGAVRSLVMVSPAGAISMLRETMEYCGRLAGRDPRLDAQLEEWATNPPTFEDMYEVKRITDRIDYLLRS